MQILKFGAIDIGSNAARLLIMNVIEDGDKVIYKKSSLIRAPIRLGFDVFKKQKIGKRRLDKLVHLMTAFSHLMQVHEVMVYRACATSAMRDAANGQQIVDFVKAKTGIKIDVIDGREEAEIIYRSRLADLVETNKNYLFVDMGGGSTEFTLITNGEMKTSRSFNIGTIRILNEQVTKDQFQELKAWILALREEFGELEVIGSGGNINRYLKLSGKKENEPLSANELHKLYKYVKSFSYEDRIKVLGLNTDRADVIIPAGKMFLKVLKYTNSDHIIVPKIGIADGIIRQLYEKYNTIRASIH